MNVRLTCQRLREGLALRRRNVHVPRTYTDEYTCYKSHQFATVRWSIWGILQHIYWRSRYSPAQLLAEYIITTLFVATKSIMFSTKYIRFRQNTSFLVQVS